MPRAKLKPLCGSDAMLRGIMKDAKTTILINTISGEQMLLQTGQALQIDDPETVVLVAVELQGGKVIVQNNIKTADAFAKMLIDVYEKPTG